MGEKALSIAFSGGSWRHPRLVPGSSRAVPAVSWPPKKPPRADPDCKNGPPEPEKTHSAANFARKTRRNSFWTDFSSILLSTSLRLRSANGSDATAMATAEAASKSLATKRPDLQKVCPRHSGSVFFATSAASSFEAMSATSARCSMLAASESGLEKPCAQSRSSKRCQTAKCSQNAAKIEPTSVQVGSRAARAHDFWRSK